MFFVVVVVFNNKTKYIRLLEKVQRRAARYVTNNYTDRSPGTVTSMLEYLKWKSLEHRKEAPFGHCAGEEGMKEDRVLGLLLVQSL